MQAIIMAGGEGVRLRPFTYLIPKPLLPLGDKSVIEHMICALADYGFDEIFVTTNYRADDFAQCLAFGPKYGVKVELIRENKRLGTVGAVHLLSKFLTGPFLLANGDLIVDTDLSLMADFHKSHKGSITIGIKKYCEQIPYGVVKWDKNHELISMTEKPEIVRYVNAGVYILDPVAINYISKNGYMDITELIGRIKQANGQIFVYDIGDCWMDMGRFKDYERAIDAIEEWKLKKEIG